MRVSAPLGAVLRAFVRIRIYRIYGIFRIAFRPHCIVLHNLIVDRRLSGERARLKNPENPLIPQILILTNAPPPIPPKISPSVRPSVLL